MPVDEQTVDRLTELTRRARAGDDEAASRRKRLLESVDAHLHVREDDDGATLVVYPASWMTDDGRVDPTRIEDVDTAIERPLDDGDDPDEDAWAAIDAHNQAVAAEVTRRHGPVHGETATALATYLSNHHLVRIEAATPRQLETFREDYFVRNAWPTAQQRALVGRSIEFARTIATAQSA